MKIIAMDFRRSLFSMRFLLITVALVAVLIASTWDMLTAVLLYGSNRSVIDMVSYALTMDRFKILMAVLLGGIYTHGYCMDENHEYVRLILTRSSLLDYCISKFLVNVVCILVACLISFFLYCGIAVCIWRVGTVVSSGVNAYTTYYYQMAYQSTPLYLAMQALQFGMVCGACSCAGILLSVVQSDAFVSIGFCGMVFFCAISYIPHNTIFDVLGLVSMYPTLASGADTPQWAMFTWGMLYPMVIIIICCQLFYKRMKWREKNGFL